MADRRPRVAQVIPWLSLGGATGLLIQLTERLLHEGYEVEIVTGPSTESGVSMGQFAEQLGVPIHTLPSFHRAPHPIRDVRALRELTHLMRERRFDIVHGHGTKGFLLGAWAARRANISATLWHVHGWGFHERSPFASRVPIVWAHRLLKPTVSRIIAVSEATKQDGLRCRIGAAEDYCVIYEAVDLERFGERPLPPEEAKRRLGLDPHRPVVGSVTRLAEQKAPLDLIDAAALLLKEMPEVQVLMVGHGPLFEATKARAVHHGIEHAVSMPGARWDVPQVLSAIDVFALTSLWEGFPICYLEAMALGIPVVGTDAGGAAESIIDGRTGFIVPPRHPELVADRLERLLRDERLRREMGEAARKHAAQFGYDRLLRDVSALYAELLNGSGWEAVQT
jgi:glycosyltransferase involved in cell wall biosynthesis